MVVFMDGERHHGRIRRGEVRDLVLAALLDGPAYGYELMGRLEQRSGGRWRPSPGSVYPLLQMLEDDGLAVARTDGGRRVFELTAEGRAQADSRSLGALAAASDRGAAHMDLRREVQQLHGAARQVGTAGSAEQVERAVAVVRQARRELYRLLAGD